MKKTKSLLALFLVLSLAITLASCNLIAPSDEKLILGKWKDSTGIIGYEFFDDSTVKFTALGFPVTGTYEMNTKEKTLSISGTALVTSVTFTYTYEIEGSKLSLTDTNLNKKVIYIRDTQESAT